jgi:hypothetical protein
MDLLKNPPKELGVSIKELVLYELYDLYSSSSSFLGEKVAILLTT